MYIPPKVADRYPQLHPNLPTPRYLDSKISHVAADVDAGTKQRKYWRFVVEDKKPMCVTVLGLEDEADGVVIVVDQLFGHPGCETRKPVNGVSFTNNVCQLVFNKPGRYELRDSEFGLFPVTAEVSERALCTETAKLLGEQGTVITL